jgi:outer membrane protein assembly factor BamB
VTSGVSRSWDLAEDLGQDVAQLGLRTTLPAPADLRYTLSVEGDLVFARLGVQELRPGRKGPEAASFLVCLDLAERGTRLHCRWYKALTGGLQDSPAVFEGAPVVSDGRVYIAATRFTLNKAITAIHCYAVDMESGAAPRWVQDVVADREEALSKPRLRHLLLTLAGPNVVLCAPGGTIIAVNALTGQRAWAVRCPGPKNGEQKGFPSSSVLHPPSSEDPCLYAEGRLYAAPSACNSLLCLDPATGQVLWERERLEVVHLLGVASGRVIFTTPRGIRAVCAVDGSDRGGWARPDYVDEVGLPSWGRGLLAGRLVFWPTTYGVKVLNQEDGTAPDDLIPLHLHNLPPGHMAYASGCLAVADAQTLSIYLSLARLPSRNQDAVELRKDEGRRKKDDGNRLKNDKPRLLHPSSFILHLSGKGGVLSRAWQTLDDVEERLLTPLTGSPALEQEVFLVQSRHLVCRDSKTGVERWRQPATWLPFWIAVYNNIVLAAGPDGVQAFALRDGRSA